MISISDIISLWPIIFLLDFAAGLVGAVILTKLLSGKWLWQLFKKNKSWAFGLSANGWSFEGSGTNPFETLKKMYDDVFGYKPKSIEERVEEQTNRLVDKQIDKVIESIITNKKVKGQLQRRAFNAAMKVLNARFDKKK